MLAPLAFSVVLVPAQTAVGVAATLTVGRAFTVTLADAVAQQPEVVPVTVYVVVFDGLTTLLTPADKPPLQAYEPAPLAVSVDVDPLQMLLGVVVRLTVGKAVTFTVVKPVPLHPAAEVPVTV